MLDIVARMRGPVAQHRLYLFRMARWGKGEPEWFLLDHLADGSRAAVDIGANGGVYAGRLAQLCPRVHAFEPNPRLASRLIETLPSNVTVHCMALSDRPGTAELRIPTMGGTEEHGLATIEARNQVAGDSLERVSCALARLDDVLMDPVGFIKIDVEGHEFAVLQGASRILQQDRPVLLVESEKRHNPDAPENVFGLLRGLGYTGLYLSDGRLRAVGAAQPSERVMNYIFVPQG
jgi:FkbM family methyltransferase